MTIPQFFEMLAEIDAADIVIDPNGNTEPNGNLCCISLSRAQADTLNPEDITRFVLNAVDRFDAKRRAVAHDHKMLFYCWVDTMAGQLRFSVVSSQPLPFVCDTRVIPDLSVIARHLLACPWLDGIPFGELEPADDSPATDETQTLDVFVLDLPRVPTAV